MKSYHIKDNLFIFESYKENETLNPIVSNHDFYTRAIHYTNKVEILIYRQEYHMSWTYLEDIDDLIIIRKIKKYIISLNNGELTKYLIDNNLEIATMESCTSGLIASNITDYEGSSAIMKGSYISYSNEAKIMFGVPSDIIDTYGVYSAETAIEMARVAKDTFKSDISIGVTGSFSNVDPNNKDSIAGEIYFQINQTGKELPYKITYHNLNLSRKDIKQKTVNIIIKAVLAHIS